MATGVSDGVLVAFTPSTRRIRNVESSMTEGAVPQLVAHMPHATTTSSAKFSPLRRDGIVLRSKRVASSAALRDVDRSSLALATMRSRQHDDHQLGKSALAASEASGFPASSGMPEAAGVHRVSAVHPGNVFPDDFVSRSSESLSFAFSSGTERRLATTQLKLPELQRASAILERAERHAEAIEAMRGSMEVGIGLAEQASSILLHGTAPAASLAASIAALRDQHRAEEEASVGDGSATPHGLDAPARLEDLQAGARVTEERYRRLLEVARLSGLNSSVIARGAVEPEPPAHNPDSASGDALRAQAGLAAQQHFPPLQPVSPVLPRSIRGHEPPGGVAQTRGAITALPHGNPSQDRPAASALQLPSIGGAVSSSTAPSLSRPSTAAATAAAVPVPSSVTALASSQLVYVPIFVVSESEVSDPAATVHASAAAAGASSLAANGPGFALHAAESLELADAAGSVVDGGGGFGSMMMSSGGAGHATASTGVGTGQEGGGSPRGGKHASAAGGTAGGGRAHHRNAAGATDAAGSSRHGRKHVLIVREYPRGRNDSGSDVDGALAVADGEGGFGEHFKSMETAVQANFGVNVATQAGPPGDSAGTDGPHAARGRSRLTASDGSGDASARSSSYQDADDFFGHGGSGRGGGRGGSYVLLRTVGGSGGGARIVAVSDDGGRRRSHRSGGNARHSRRRHRDDRDSYSYSDSGSDSGSYSYSYSDSGRSRSRSPSPRRHRSRERSRDRSRSRGHGHGHRHRTHGRRSSASPPQGTSRSVSPSAMLKQGSSGGLLSGQDSIAASGSGSLAAPAAVSAARGVGAAMAALMRAGGAGSVAPTPRAARDPGKQAVLQAMRGLTVSPSLLSVVDTLASGAGATGGGLPSAAGFGAGAGASGRNTNRPRNGDATPSYGSGGAVTASGSMLMPSGSMDMGSLSLEGGASQQRHAMSRRDSAGAAAPSSAAGVGIGSAAGSASASASAGKEHAGTPVAAGAASASSTLPPRPTRLSSGVGFGFSGNLPAGASPRSGSFDASGIAEQVETSPALTSALSSASPAASRRSSALGRVRAQSGTGAMWLAQGGGAVGSPSPLAASSGVAAASPAAAAAIDVIERVRRASTARAQAAAVAAAAAAAATTGSAAAESAVGARASTADDDSAIGIACADSASSAAEESASTDGGSGSFTPTATSSARLAGSVSAALQSARLSDVAPPVAVSPAVVRPTPTVRTADVDGYQGRHPDSAAATSAVENTSNVQPVAQSQSARPAMETPPLSSSGDASAGPNVSGTHGGRRLSTGSAAGANAAAHPEAAGADGGRGPNTASSLPRSPFAAAIMQRSGQRSSKDKDRRGSGTGGGEAAVHAASGGPGLTRKGSGGAESESASEPEGFSAADLLFGAPSRPGTAPTPRSLGAGFSAQAATLSGAAGGASVLAQGAAKRDSLSVLLQGLATSPAPAAAAANGPSATPATQFAAGLSNGKARTALGSQRGPPGGGSAAPAASATASGLPSSSKLTNRLGGVERLQHIIGSLSDDDDSDAEGEISASDADVSDDANIVT